jgi:hypothetical protein
MGVGPDDDRGRDDRAARRGDPDLIDADDPLGAVAPQAALETE